MPATRSNPYPPQMPLSLDIDRIRQGLAAHPLFTCADDIEETCNQVSQIFRPHELGVIGARQHLDAHMDHVRFGGVSFNRLRYASHVAIASEPFENFLLVMMPLAGSAAMTCGKQSVVSAGSQSAVVDATRPLSMRWDQACEQLIIRIERDAIESTCRAYLGKDLCTPLQFEMGMDLRNLATAGWQSAVSLLGSQDALTQRTDDFPLLQAQAEHLLITALLTAQPHNYREALSSPAEQPAPFFVRRAKDYLLAHCADPITPEDLSAHVGVSLRSLYAGFQRHHGTTPMAFLREARLERARASLLQACAERRKTTVSAIAMEWGFSHLGRFTQAYLARFAEHPSKTLRGGLA